MKEFLVEIKVEILKINYKIKKIFNFYRLNISTRISHKISMIISVYGYRLPYIDHIYILYWELKRDKNRDLNRDF